MPHPDEGLIHAWLDGELDAAEAARVETLAASDPEWGAAVAEARGLIAATSRITSALDRVPAQVIPAAPKPKAKSQLQPASQPRRATHAWMWRVAAGLVIVTGSALVLDRQQPAVLPPAGVIPRAVQRPAPPPVEQRREVLDRKEKKTNKSTLQQEQLSSEKSLAATASGAAAAPVPAAVPTRGSAGASAKEVAPGPNVPPVNAAANAATANRAMFAKAAVAALCFEQREPADSTRRVVLLAPDALADSIRLEKLALHGDTLAAVAGPFRAIRVRCP